MVKWFTAEKYGCKVITASYMLDCAWLLYDYSPPQTNFKSHTINYTCLHCFYRYVQSTTVCFLVGKSLVCEVLCLIDQLPMVVMVQSVSFIFEDDSGQLSLGLNFYSINLFVCTHAWSREEQLYFWREKTCN